MVAALDQPLTVAQLATRTQTTSKTCSEELRQLRTYEIVACLNPHAHRHRVYWLTRIGLICRRRLRGDQEDPDEFCARHGVQGTELREWLSALTAVLASIGTAAVPSAGIVMLVIIL